MFIQGFSCTFSKYEMHHFLYYGRKTVLVVISGEILRCTRGFQFFYMQQVCNEDSPPVIYINLTLLAGSADLKHYILSQKPSDLHD